MNYSTTLSPTTTPRRELIITNQSKNTPAEGGQVVRRGDALADEATPLTPTVTLTDLQATVRLRLSGSLRTYMKESDIRYAESLLTKRTVTTRERQWLISFIAWYDPYNVDAVRRYAEEHGIIGSAIDRVQGTVKAARATIAANVRAAVNPPVGPASAEDADEVSPPSTAGGGALGFVGIVGIAAVAGVTAYAVTRAVQ